MNAINSVDHDAHNNLVDSLSKLLNLNECAKQIHKTAANHYNAGGVGMADENYAIPKPLRKRLYDFKDEIIESACEEAICKLIDVSLCRVSFMRPGFIFEGSIRVRIVIDTTK